MGRLGALIANFFDGQSLQAYENSLRLKEALQILHEKYHFEIISWYSANLSKNYLDSKKDLNLREFLLEVDVRRKIVRIHLSYHPSGIIPRENIFPYSDKKKHLYEFSTVFSGREMRTDHYVDEVLLRERNLKELQR